MKLSTLESAILGLLNKNLKYKITSVPVVDFLRHNIILNLQYTGEEFISPNTVNAVFSVGKASVITYDLVLYYKDVRNSYEEIHDIIDRIIDKVHGKQLEIADTFYCSPILVDKIEFQEKNQQNYIIYKCGLKLKIGR